MSEKDENDIQRRSFLKNTAAAGVGAIGFSALADKGAAQEDVTVTEVSGSESAKLSAKAMKDARVGKLLQSFDGKVHPQMNATQTYHTSTADSEWDTVVIPFARSERKQINLFWTSNENFDSQVLLNEAVHVSGTKWKMTEYHISGNSVTTTSGTVSSDKFTQGEIGTQGILDCNVNWGCVLSTAGAYAGVVGACGSCYASSGLLVPACASCIGTILGSAGLTISCDYCN